MTALRNTRHLEAAGFIDSTPVAEENPDPERYRLYRLCACGDCLGTGKLDRDQALAIAERLGRRVTKQFTAGSVRISCPSCRGEGRALELVATCGTPEAVGVALVTLGREGEWNECPVGVLDTAGAKNEKWIVTPWLPSARNVSDAGRTLARSRRTP